MRWKGLAAAGLAAALLAGLCACGDKSGGEAVTVQSVQEITGGALSAPDRFAGMVVAGQTEKIQKDENKKVLELLVAEGDYVKAGDVLFTYDTQAMEFDLEKLKLEYEGYESAIRSAESQIGELEDERDEAASADKLEYTLQIEEQEANIRENEYNAALKQREIDNMEASMANTEVAASIDGRVMSVQAEDGADNGEMYYDDGTGDSAYITVMDLESVRVEGNINELNAGALVPGMAVTIRSRTDDAAVWSGTVDSIDWENPVQGNNGDYYVGDTDAMTASSKYPFYITLDDHEGLILGQHVYIEPSYGEDAKSGLWLGSYWFGSVDGDAWLWVEGANGKLEKRSVTLGEYDADMDEYQILDGLDGSDYIAFPEEGFSEGMPTARWEEFGENTASTNTAHDPLEDIAA